MKSQTAIFSLLCIKPHTTPNLIKKLEYSKYTIYKALDKLEDKNLVIKERKKNNITLKVADTYKAQKRRDITLSALTNGIDPEILLRDSTIQILKSLDSKKSLKDLKEETKLSYLWIQKIINFLDQANLVTYIKRKPKIMIANKENDLFWQIKHYLEEKEAEVIYTPGETPFNLQFMDSSEVEKSLYSLIDKSFTIKGTQLLVLGDTKLNIIESFKHHPSIEDVFLKKIQTQEGVEDICIQLIGSKKIDYNKLLELAKKQELINIVGAYLDIINELNPLVESQIIELFQKHITKRKKIFLKSQKNYPKEGWEKKYEKKWNLDIHLDLGTIKHGVRAL